MSRRLAAIVIATSLASSVLAAEDPAHIEVTATQILASDTLPATERAQTLVTRGLAREKLHRPKEAYDDFTYALSLHALSSADVARVRFDRGVVLEEMNRTEEAIADYTAAINFEPRFAAAYNNRANAYRRLGRLDEATRDYQTSLRYGNPQPEYPFYGLGQIAEALGQAETARGYYQEALTHNPYFALAAQRLAVMNAPDFTPVLRLRPPPISAEAAQAASPTPPRKARGRLGPAPIQMGAFHDEAAAQAQWNRIVTVAGDLLDGQTLRILPLDQRGGRRLYRLQTGPFEHPREVCDRLEAMGFPCFPARDPGSMAAASGQTAASP